MARQPPYFDGLIAAFERGRVGRFVHLGSWDAPPGPDALAERNAFELAQRRLNERVLALSALADGLRVLDVGCGFGGTLQAVDEQYNDMVLVGLNPDSRQLAICRSLQPQRTNDLRWVRADACKLPLAEASIDRLLCLEAMFHFASRRQFFREASRVIAPAGVVVVSDIILRPAARQQYGDAADASLSQIVSQGFGMWPDFWGADADHRELAAAAGLVCTHHEDISDATLPSHLFTAPRGAASRDPVGRAAATLAMLHRSGRLSYVVARFERA